MSTSAAYMRAGRLKTKGFKGYSRYYKNWRCLAPAIKQTTRSGSRNHPFRRNRRMGSGSGRSGSRRRPRQPAATQTTIMGSDVDPGGCIDLTTNDTLDGDIIDLTDSFNTANNSTFDADPVVVISPTDVDNADSFQRENGHRRRVHRIEPWNNQEEEVGVIDVEATPSSSTGSTSRSRAARSNTTIDVEDVSDEDLPIIPFTVGGANVSLSSPEPVKITCPVCMETDTQIRRDKHRQLFSTHCGHIFCSSCIKQAIDSQRMCPTCRRRLTRKQIHQIYL